MRPASSVLLVALVALVAAVAGGCSAGHHSDGSPVARSTTTVSAQATTGTLTGKVEYVGGPPGTHPRPVAQGTVMFAGAGQEVAAISEHGRFSAALKPGTYTVTATSPDYNAGHEPCEAMHQVRVAAGETVSTVVFCQVR
jgi:hypothetical protein